MDSLAIGAWILLGLFFLVFLLNMVYNMGLSKGHSEGYDKGVRDQRNTEKKK